MANSKNTGGKKGKGKPPKKSAAKPKGGPKAGKGKVAKIKVKPRGPRQQYPKEIAIQAAREYIEGIHTSFRKAAKYYGGIPESTVRDYYKLLVAARERGEDYSTVKAKLAGHIPTLDVEYEGKMAQHCIDCGNRGFGKSKT